MCFLPFPVSFAQVAALVYRLESRPTFGSGITVFAIEKLSMCTKHLPYLLGTPNALNVEQRKQGSIHQVRRNSDESP